MAAKKRKKVIPFGRLVGKLKRSGYSAQSSKNIAGFVARRAKKGPGQSRFKPRTKAGKARYSKK